MSTEPLTPRVRTDSNMPCAAVITQTASYWPGGIIRVRAETPAVVDVLENSARMAPHATVVYAGVRPPQRPADAVKEAGWRAWHAGPWTTYSRNGRTVAVGQLDDCGDDQPLFTTATDVLEIIARLQEFGQATEYTWLGTCATTALGALRLTWENTPGKPLWRHPCPVADSSSGALNWSRKPTRAEAKQPAWSWDVNGMYLASAGAAEVAWSGLEHTGTLLSFDAKLPGYWQVQVPPTDSPYAPPLIDPSDVDKRGRAWVTTPTAQRLQQLHGAVIVHDSFTGRASTLGKGHVASARVFRRWSEQFAHARRVAGESTRPAVKRTYASLVGGMRRDTMTVYRTDWAHTIIDLARVNMLRRIWRVRSSVAGLWPVSISTDEVTYRCPPELVRYVEDALGVCCDGYPDHKPDCTNQLGSFKRSGGAW